VAVAGNGVGAGSVALGLGEGVGASVLVTARGLGETFPVSGTGEQPARLVMPAKVHNRKTNA